MKKRKAILVSCLMVCVTVISFGQTLLLNEDFSSGSLPASWSNDSLGNSATYLWDFTNPGARQITGSYFDTSFVILDSDHYGSGANQYASLTTAAVSAIGYTSLNLSFDEQYFGQLVNGSLRTIEASGDSGLSWYTLVSDSVSVGYPVAVNTIFNLDTLAGSANVTIRFTYSGSWDYWWAIDNVKLSALMPCTSPPSAGQAVTSHDSVCAGNLFQVSLSGFTNGTGLTFQWQQSADAVNWIDIAGATTENTTLSQQLATWYRCYVSCSGLSDTSSSVLVGNSHSALCYCVPAGAGCSSTNYITKVSILNTTLSNSSACQQNDLGTAYHAYPDAGNTTATLLQNGNYLFEIYSVGSNLVSLWIDLDHSGTFDSVEWKQVTTSSVQGMPDTVTITIPDSTLQGKTAFRVRTRAIGNTITATDACSSFVSGETEDYYITIDTLLNATYELTHFDFSLFPNPARAMVTVMLPASSKISSTIKVMNLLGSEMQPPVITYSDRVNIDLQVLPHGIYFVQVIHDGYAVSRKLIVSGK